MNNRWQRNYRSQAYKKLILYTSSSERLNLNYTLKKTRYITEPFQVRQDLRNLKWFLLRIHGQNLFKICGTKKGSASKITRGISRSWWIRFSLFEKSIVLKRLLRTRQKNQVLLQQVRIRYLRVPQKLHR